MTPGSLWESITAAGKPRGRLHGARTAIDLADLSHRTSLGGRLEELEGCSVVLLIRNQLTAALAMIELDGVAAPHGAVPAGPGGAAPAGGDARRRSRRLRARCRGPAGRHTRCSAHRHRRHPAAAHARAAARAARDRVDPADLRHHRCAKARPALRSRASPARSPGSRAAARAVSCGAPSTTSAATAACRSSCARCTPARWCCRRRPSRWSISSRAPPPPASPTSRARPRTGAAP